MDDGTRLCDGGAGVRKRPIDCLEKSSAFREEDTVTTEGFSLGAQPTVEIELRRAQSCPPGSFAVHPNPPSRREPRSDRTIADFFFFPRLIVDDTKIVEDKFQLRETTPGDPITAGAHQASSRDPEPAETVPLMY